MAYGLTIDYNPCMMFHYDINLANPIPEISVVVEAFTLESTATFRLSDPFSNMAAAVVRPHLTQRIWTAPVVAYLSTNMNFRNSQLESEVVASRRDRKQVFVAGINRASGQSMRKHLAAQSATESADVTREKLSNLSISALDHSLADT